MSSRQERSRRKTETVKPKTVCTARGKPLSTGACLIGPRCLPVRAIVMVNLMMVPHRGVPVVAVHVSERHRWGSKPRYDEDSKSLFENVFHGNPGGSVRLVSVEKRDAKPEATAMRRHFNAVTESESTRELWERVRASP